MKRPILLFIALLGSSTGALAHPPEHTQIRELVRLQGHRSADADAPAGRLTLAAQGADHPFGATDHRAFTTSTEEQGALATSYSLQGPRDALYRFATARPDQTVTILAEHHLGSKDLFLLAVDLCPPK